MLCDLILNLRSDQRRSVLFDCQTLGPDLCLGVRLSRPLHEYLGLGNVRNLH